MSNETAELLDVRAAAALLGRTERAIRKDIERRRLPFRRHGSRILFVRSELATFLASLDGVSVEEAVANVRNGSERCRVSE
jgi:excisionase family DNA binding protein